MPKSPYLQLARIFTVTGLIISSIACLVILGLAIRSFFSPATSIKDKITLEVPLEIKSDYKDLANVSFKDNLFLAKRIEYNDVELEVYPANNIPLTQGLIYLVGLVYLLIIASILYQLYRILASFTNPFQQSNIKRIQKIGFLVMGIELYRIMMILFVQLTIGSKVRIVDAEIASFKIMDVDLPIIFLGIIILTLAEVFKQGLVLQEFENQTV